MAQPSPEPERLPQQPRPDRLRHWIRDRRTGLLILTLYAGVAVYSTWPLARSMAIALPLGTEPVATVPLFNLWTIWWNADRSADFFANYWDAPIFYPARNTFAFSEPQPTSVLVAPLVWAGEIALAYNLYLLAALTLNGWSTCRLLRSVGLGTAAAISGGLMVEMLPVVHWQLGVLQLVPMFGVVWTIHALYSFGREPTVRRGLLLGGAFAVTYLLCNYHGLFLSVLLLLSGWWLLGRQIVNWRAWSRLLPGAALCLAVIGPLIWLQMRLSKAHEWERPPELMEELSAEWHEYTAAPWKPLIPVRGAAANGVTWRLSLGVIKAGVAVCGLLWGLATGRRLFTAFLLTFTALAATLSIGLNLQIGDWKPYQVLIDHYPGFAQARNVFRFSFFAQLGVACLAAIGLQMLASLIELPFARKTKPDAAGAEHADAGAPQRFHWGRMVASPVVLAAGWLAALEIIPATQRLFPMPRWERNQAWIAWLRDETPPGSVIACVPFPAGRDAAAYFHQTIWMYWGTFHHRPMVNGYSGFFPDHFLELKDEMQPFPQLAALNALRRNGARYVVIWRAVLDSGSIVRRPRLAGRLQWRFGDDRAAIDIYELR